MASIPLWAKPFFATTANFASPVSKRRAPVCRIIQRPQPASPLGPGTYLTLMQRPGDAYTDLMLGDRAECLRAAIEIAANRAEYDAQHPNQ